MNRQFAGKRGYGYDIEKTIMKQIKLQYQHGEMGKGCIAMMVVRRKSELANITNKRSTNTHEGNILMKRTSIETRDKGRVETKSNRLV